MGTEETHLNRIKAILDKPTANIILKGEKLKTLCLRSGTRQWCLLSSILFNIVLEVLTIATRKEKKVGGESKLEKRKYNYHCLQMIYIENSQNSCKLLELINEFGKVAGYKINKQKPVAFLYSNNSEREIKKTIPLTNVSKRIKCLGINLSKKWETYIL